MTKGRKRLLWTCFLVPVFAAALFVLFAIFNPFHAHEHCIKNTGLALRNYATDHNGNFPSHTNGFGDALVVLLKEGYLGATNGIQSSRLITGPGDDGQMFLDALRTAAPIPEEKCSRIYVQGLSERSNPGIAILFDKKPTRGGDHGRRPWGPLLREVSLSDSSMQIIQEENWRSFASNQIELLVQEGIQRPLAEHYYRLAEYKH
jgi:hypothetical protein